MESRIEDPWTEQIEARIMALRLMMTMLVMLSGNREQIAEALKNAMDSVASSPTTTFDNHLVEELDQLRNELL